MPSCVYMKKLSKWPHEQHEIAGALPMIHVHQTAHPHTHGISNILAVEVQMPHTHGEDVHAEGRENHEGLCTILSWLLDRVGQKGRVNL